MKYIIYLTFLTVSITTFAQKKLPRGVNTANEKEYNPSVTADDRTLYFLRKYAMGPTYSLFQAPQVQNGVWGRPVEIDFYNTLSQLIYIPGYSISADGNTIYFSYKKTPGIGRYDIWFSENTNGTWSAPANYYKPLNSELDDICPTVTTDGNTMYFVRGNKVENEIISGDIFVAERKGKDSWTTPTKLVGAINTGNETQPVILPDNQTLVFASNRPGGKGGFDLYQSRLENGTWSTPVNMDFLNDAEDNIDYSVAASGTINYFSKLTVGETIDIYMERIPEEYQAKKVTLLHGKINTQGTIYVFDAETNTQISKVEPTPNGEYFLTLTEGKAYDVCFYPKEKNYGFHSELYDVRNQEKYQRIKKDITLSIIKSGSVLPLNNVYFNKNAANFADYSTGELMRLVRTLQANADNKFIIKNYFSEYKEDSIQSPTLTETKEKVQVINTDATSNTITKTIYHNDKTEAQANSIRDFLIEKGIPEARIKVEGITDCDKSRVEIYFE